MRVGTAFSARFTEWRSRDQVPMMMISTMAKLTVGWLGTIWVMVRGTEAAAAAATDTLETTRVRCRSVDRRRRAGKTGTERSVTGMSWTNHQSGL